MNVIFLTLLDFQSYSERNLYCDLLREFIKNGHDVYCISPVERKAGVETHFEENGRLLKLKIGNTQKTNIIEKGVSTLMLESQFVKAIKTYFSDVIFDLVLYSTPPITLASAVEYIKKRDNAKTYLLLKDIFPQNAVDLGMMTKNGLKGCIYQFFRKKEKSLYALSDKIGCMSQANVDYVLEHNPEITSESVEICANCVEVQDMRLTQQMREELRDRYGIPQDKKVFAYVGNLGKPQDIRFIVECLKACAEVDNAYFVIAGSGTERGLLEAYVNAEQPGHVKLFEQMPKDECDRMVACCDVGLIFLDRRFTIPNFPSRLLAYMQAGLPILASTDACSDLGKVITEGGFGKWCESVDAAAVADLVTYFTKHDSCEMGALAYRYLEKHYSVEVAYRTIAQLWES